MAREGRVVRYNFSRFHGHRDNNVKKHNITRRLEPSINVANSYYQRRIHGVRGKGRWEWEERGLTDLVSCGRMAAMEPFVRPGGPTNGPLSSP